MARTLLQEKLELQHGKPIEDLLKATMGKGEVSNLTFTWEFEEIIPDFAKVNFAGVPVLGP